jgi:putative ABC transport system permease protein
MIQLLAALRIALRALRVNLLRSALTMLGIVIGVAAVITMVAVGSGARQQVQEQIRSLGANLLIILSGSVTSGGARLGLGSRLTISEDDALAIVRDIPGIVAVAPVYRGGAQVVYGNANWSTAILGITPEYLAVREWEVEYGRGFLPEDQAGKAKVALLGVTVAEQLFGDSDPMGQSIRIRNVPFTVIGVMARKGRNTQGQDQDDTILVPLSTAKKRVLGTTAIRSRSVQAIMVKVEDASLMGEAVDNIRELLRQRHRLQGTDQDDFSIRNLTEIQEAREQSAQILGLLLAAVASVSLVVGGIGIMNIMLVSVTERTREIGLRMAIGARGREILAQFLIEAVTLSLIGGAIGVGLGIAAAFIVADLANWPALIGASSILLAVGFSAAIGVFFGFYPARKAARLDPIIALRYE